MALQHQIVAFEHDPAAHDLPGGFGDEPHEGQTGHRFSRPGFPHEGQRLSGLEREAHSIHRFGDPSTREEVRLQVFHDQQR